jgi:hypothetical protein
MPEYIAKLRDKKTNRIIQRKIFEGSYSEAEKEAKFLAKKYKSKLISVDNNNFPIGEHRPVAR